MQDVSKDIRDMIDKSLSRWKPYILHIKTKEELDFNYIKMFNGKTDLSQEDVDTIIDAMAFDAWLKSCDIVQLHKQRYDNETKALISEPIEDKIINMNIIKCGCGQRNLPDGVIESIKCGDKVIYHI